MSEERRVLSLLLTSPDTLAHAASAYKPEILCESAFARTVCRWALDFLKTDPKVPAAMHMMDIYVQRSEEVADETENGAIREYLQNLSRDWQKEEPASTDYAKELADKYFGRRARCKALERMQGAFEAGDMESFDRAVEAYNKPGGVLAARETIDMLRDAKRVAEGLQRRKEDALFMLPGALGQMVGPIVRGDFVGILAREKMGKSWFVDLVAIAAMYAGCHVCIFDLDLVADQKIDRLWRHLRGQPSQPGTYRIPYFAKDNSIGLSDVPFTVESQDEASVERHMRGLRRLADGGSLEFVDFPVRGASIADLRGRMQAHVRKTGRPYDLVIVDSPDYLDEPKERNTFDRLGAVWSGVRGLAQEFNCATLGPSHIGRQNGKGKGSEDEVFGNVQKLWNVTKTVLLNATPHEKEHGIVRCSTNTSRDHGTTSDEVVVLQGLDVARPYLDSRWLSHVRSDLVYQGKKRSDLDG